MTSGPYDIITVGGGLGGVALAKVMAEHGVRVLVLEREKQFKDRVRGEGMFPWEVAEMQALGEYIKKSGSRGQPSSFLYLKIWIPTAEGGS
jgi:flavin-dependent dehydrogenase